MANIIDKQAINKNARKRSHEKDVKDFRRAVFPTHSFVPYDILVIAADHPEIPKKWRREAEIQL